MPYRISGHESFPLRYAWLPKAVRWLEKKPDLFANEQQAMVDLGVGKNMVRAIRFWALAAGVIDSAKRGEHCVTPLGKSILANDGADPFLEDIRTLWLVHWKLSTNGTNPLLAWEYLLNFWQDPKLAPSAAVAALKTEAEREDQHLSAVTLQQHFETFLHTYIPTRGRKGEVQEDNLDSPLVELELLVKAGEREVDTSGRREAVYAFRREEKPDVTPELFVYCVADFWIQRHSGEETLPFNAVATGRGGPGQIFKIPEEDIRTRLAMISRDSQGRINFSDASSLPQLRRTCELDSAEFLDAIYHLEGANV